MTPRFVVVGTGRSGSGYIATVLTKAGILCGGESWWNPQGKQDPTVIGDSSCCALPLGLDDYDGVIFHQLRHPLDSILSMVHRPVRDPHRSLFHRLVPDAPDDDLDFAMRFWLAATREAERFRPRWWRVDQVDADLICDIAGTVGLPIDPDAAAAAVQSVPATFNEHYSNRMPRLTWSHLRDRDPVLTNDIAECAYRYGFDS